MSLLRLLSLAVFAFVLTHGGRAAAATAVPMCGSHAESIAAPPSFRAASDAVLAACAGEHTFELGEAPSPPPQRLTVPDAPARALFGRAWLVCAGAAARLPIESLAVARERPGHAGSVFRPPRA